MKLCVPYFHTRSGRAVKPPRLPDSAKPDLYFVLGRVGGSYPISCYVFARAELEAIERVNDIVEQRANKNGTFDAKRLHSLLADGIDWKAEKVDPEAVLCGQGAWAGNSGFEL